MKLLFTMIVLGLAPMVQASVMVYGDNYPGFLAAAGSVNTISFAILPNGQPSVAGTAITSTFNYDAQGAHFTASSGTLRISGSATTSWDIIAQAAPPSHITSVLGDLIAPSRAIGVFSSGGLLSVFGASNVFLGSLTVGGTGPQHFGGIISDVPIVRIEFGNGSSVAGINSFVFQPVPEPAVVALLAVGVCWLLKHGGV